MECTGRLGWRMCSHRDVGGCAIAYTSVSLNNQLLSYRSCPPLTYSTFVSIFVEKCSWHAGTVGPDTCTGGLYSSYHTWATEWSVSKLCIGCLY